MTNLYDPTEESVTTGPTIAGLQNAIMGDKDDDESSPLRQIQQPEINFERIDAANEWRDAHPDALADTDSRVTKTVTLRADVADDVQESAESAAFETQHTGKKYGQRALTDAERARLEDRSDWRWSDKGFHAQAAKAVLVEEGADDWLDYYNPDLEPIEHASVVGQSKGDAMRLGLTGPGETGEVDDSDPDMNDLARQHSKGVGQACGSAKEWCEEGDVDACQHLKEECEYTDEEIEDLREAFDQIGEDVDLVLDGTIYDPTHEEMVTAVDSGAVPFEQWAADNEPGAVEPSDEELANLAPTPTSDPADLDQLPGPALRALKKAWSGYRLARKEHRDADRRASKYAGIINGVRAVNGQEPLSFDALDGWAGGDVLPDGGTETYPGPDGNETLTEAVEHGHASMSAQAALSQFGGNVFDPTEKL